MGCKWCCEVLTTDACFSFLAGYFFARSLFFQMEEMWKGKRTQPGRCLAHPIILGKLNFLLKDKLLYHHDIVITTLPSNPMQQPIKKGGKKKSCLWAAPFLCLSLRPKQCRSKLMLYLRLWQPAWFTLNPPTDAQQQGALSSRLPPPRPRERWCEPLG